MELKKLIKKAERLIKKEERLIKKAERLIKKVERFIMKVEGLIKKVERLIKIVEKLIKIVEKLIKKVERLIKKVYLNYIFMAGAIGTSSRSAFKGIEMWKEETKLKKSEAERQTIVNSQGELVINTGYEPLVPKEEKTGLQLMMFNMNFKKMLILFLVWLCFLLLQVFKNDVVACSRMYWGFNLLQFPIALGLFGYECVKLYKESKSRKLSGNQEMICEACIDWTAMNLGLCAICGLLGGTVGGLLGSGGGFVLGPLLLEIGVIPQVASATATFVMMFSASLSVVEFYLLKRFPIPFAIYLTCVSILAGFWGQCLVRKIVAILKRASIIVFILSGVIFVSAITMGVIGVEKSMSMIKNHEFMGFLDFCSSQ